MREFRGGFLKLKVGDLVKGKTKSHLEEHIESEYFYQVVSVYVDFCFITNIWFLLYYVRAFS